MTITEHKRLIASWQLMLDCIQRVKCWCGFHEPWLPKPDLCCMTAHDGSGKLVMKYQICKHCWAIYPERSKT